VDITFCARCGARIRPSDLKAGRCRREGNAAWCPACTKALAGVPPGSARALVVGEPPASKAPLGVDAVSAKGSRPSKKKPGNREDGA
jgi:hypothetical protein